MLPEMIIGSGKAEIEIQTKLRNFVRSEIDRRRLTGKRRRKRIEPASFGGTGVTGTESLVY